MRHPEGENGGYLTGISLVVLLLCLILVLLGRRPKGENSRLIDLLNSRLDTLGTSEEMTFD